MYRVKRVAMATDMAAPMQGEKVSLCAHRDYRSAI